MTNYVEYIIGLLDKYSPAAERITKSSVAADKSITAMGQAANLAETKIDRVAVSMGKLAQAQEKSALKIAEAKRANDLYFESQNRIEKQQIRMLETYQAKKGLMEKGLLPPQGGGGGMLPKGLHTGIGLYALAGMGGNNVFKDWMSFDEEMRKTRGTLAGQMSEEDLTKLRSSALEVSRGTRFSPEDVAKLYFKQASSGIDMAAINKETGKMIGPTIAKQMMGIATATGESMDQTFDTHLKIQRGFKMPIESFPHISDTIARVHQKTGISLAQIDTQMGQIAAVAGTAGWTEEQTAAALGILAQRGMGRFAGSGLARMISRTSTWSKPAAQEWKDLHINREDLINQKTGNMIAPADLMGLLEERTKGMRPADVQAAMHKIFGDRGEKIADQLNGSSAALRSFADDLVKVNGLSEKMGEEGSKGGAAGVARFTASLERLHTAIGEAGYGDWVGNMGSKLGGIFDNISDGSPAVKQSIGAVSAVGEGLSKMAMPLLAMSIVGPMVGGVFSKIGAGLMLMGPARLAAAATSMTRIAAAGRLLMGVTGVGAALILADLIWENWDKLAAAMERVKKAAVGLLHGDTSEFKSLMAEGASPAPKGVVGSRWAHATDTPSHSPNAAAAAASNALHQRMIVESKVKVTVDPIQIKDATVNVRVIGQINGPVQGTGSGPISAFHPRGSATAEPAAPMVSR